MFTTLVITKSTEPGVQAGAVTTIEQGYIASDNTDVPEQWRGIGVRIEDDVLVTKSGYRILSTGVPKTVSKLSIHV